MTLLSPNTFTHEEWLEWRREGIGGSDAASVLQCEDAFNEPHEIWQQKVMGTTSPDNPAMKKGREREPLIREWFENHIGDLFRPMLAVHDQYPWIRASLDGIDISCIKALEIKNAGKKDHGLAVLGVVPDKYLIQCQHIMQAVPTLEMVYYVSCPSDGEIEQSVVIEIERDDEFINSIMFPREKEFWKMVVNKTEPEKKKKREKIDFSHSLEYQKLIQIKEQINDLEDQYKLLANDLQQQAQENDLIGLNYTYCMTEDKGRIKYEEAFKDYLANLKALYPDIKLPPLTLEPYRGSSVIKWSLRAMKK